jgi:signal transduction histidine kinase
MASAELGSQGPGPARGRGPGLLTSALRAPVAGLTWRAVTYCLLCLPVAFAGFGLTFLLLIPGAALTLSVIGAIPGLALVGGGLSVARAVARLNRWLARTLLGLHLPDFAPVARGYGVLGRLEARLRDTAGWRSVAYVLVQLPLEYLGCGLLVLVWGYGLFFLGYPLLWKAAEDRAAARAAVHLPAVRSPVLSPLPFGSLHIHTLGGAFAVMALAVPVLLAAPWAGRGVAAAQGWLLSRLVFAPGLAERVKDLEQTRALAVDDAQARLRRVERDLHDGAQARLVALAMTLGMAKEKLGAAGPVPDTEEARALLEAAHASAKEAITELRVLARGIHPPVLDNGLPDALASLAASSVVPVGVFADLPTRPTAAIEAIAYFCAAELIANLGKHSGARRASLELRPGNGELRLRVWDDGAGGATLVPGGGLAGLADRVRTVDGRVEIDSPAGGPTAVTVSLPLHA